MISSKNLANAIYQISIDESLNQKDILNGILLYVKENRLESLLPKAIYHLEKRLEKDFVWNTLKIQSGFDLDLELVQSIAKKLNVKDGANIEKEIDKDLIGGFVATHKGVIYDISLKNQLELLRQVLIK